ncbi:MAG: cell division protein FtsH, partial [Leptonema sp. (in: Bacteria)]|nr:cell division protein FtsH [Leptonema sp. (in: bacteria)]
VLITEKEKEVIAYHEGGHALLGTLLPYAEPVHKVTIIPRGRALGVTQQLPEDDRHIQPKKYWLDRICVLMGGYLAESIIFGDTSTGASNDIQVATNIARRMVCEWGMSEKLGTISYSQDNSNVFLGREISSARHYSEETAAAIDSEVKRFVQEQRERGRELLTNHREKLERIAKALLESETIGAEELNGIVGSDMSEKQRRVVTHNSGDDDNKKESLPPEFEGGHTPAPAT